MREDEVPQDLLASANETDGALVVDVDGFEGPLDLLLTLARQQKVDLAKISVLALAEQYLAFIEQARALRLEIAADYLLMAAWLAYLKSRLLLPEPPKDENPTGLDLAAALTERLQKLALIQKAGQSLLQRPRAGYDHFARGYDDVLLPTTKVIWLADYTGLLKAYTQQRARTALAHVTLKARQVWSIAEARAALERLTGLHLDWFRFDLALLADLNDPALRVSALASSFTAALELAREGVLALQQDKPFDPIYMRSTPRGTSPHNSGLTEGEARHG